MAPLSEEKRRKILLNTPTGGEELKTPKTFRRERELDPKAPATPKDWLIALTDPISQLFAGHEKRKVAVQRTRGTPKEALQRVKDLVSDPIFPIILSGGIGKPPKPTGPIVGGTPNVPMIRPTGPTVPAVFQQAKPLQISQGFLEGQLVDALNKAGTIKTAQKSILTKGRATQIARGKQTGKTTAGESGFLAEKGALKGQILQKEFDSLRTNIPQESVDGLFTAIKDSPKLGYFQTINARQGLFKVLDGKLPNKGELELMGRVFSPETIKTILSKRPLLTKLKEAGLQAWNIPRAIMASVDLSFAMRQGLFLMGRPKQFLPAFVEQFPAFLSEGRFQGTLDTILKDDFFPIADEAGLEITTMSPLIGQREEAFISEWADKIPLVRRSGRAFTAMRDKLAFDTFKSTALALEKSGLNLSQNKAVLSDLAEYVNTATGRGKLPGALDKIATELTFSLFSPRFLASRVRLLNPVSYAKLDPLVRKEALKDLLRTVGIVGGLLTLGSTFIPKAKVSFDPRSSDFLKLKIGDTRIDFLGGFQQYMVFLSRLLSGEMVSSSTGKITKLGEGYRSLTRVGLVGRFAESKTSPSLNWFIDAIRGQTAIGEKFNFPESVRRRLTPMAVQDFRDIAKENPELIPFGIFGVLGAGIQAYKSRGSGKRGLVRRSKTKRTRGLVRKKR